MKRYHSMMNQKCSTMLQLSFQDHTFEVQSFFSKAIIAPSAQYPFLTIMTALEKFYMTSYDWLIRSKMLSCNSVAKIVLPDHTYEMQYHFVCKWKCCATRASTIFLIGRFSNNETRIMINNSNLRGLILMKLKI